MQNINDRFVIKDGRDESSFTFNPSLHYVSTLKQMPMLVQIGCIRNI